MYLLAMTVDEPHVVILASRVRATAHVVDMLYPAPRKIWVISLDLLQRQGGEKKNPSRCPVVVDRRRARI